MTTLRRIACGLALAGVLLPAAVQAATRAWLDRTAIGQDETATLNIETDQPGVAPDYTPLEAAFELGQPHGNSPDGVRRLFGIALSPKTTGALVVPALQVGAERTAPMLLQVAAPAARRAHGDVFLETTVDDQSPYVQQSVGVSVRLHYATPLLQGELSQDAPDGASLQRVGDDVQGSREVGGRRYHVVERRYLLVPERSGELRLPPARFRGRSAGGFFDELFGNDRSLSAQAEGIVLHVRAQPAGAPQPWLPLHGLELRYRDAPARARVGEAVELVVEARAQGATAAQFPDIPAPSVPGAQIFAERAQASERFVDGRPHVTVTRRFSLVPLRPGPLEVPSVSLEWWDASAGKARRARLPALELQAAPAAAGATDLQPASGAGMPVDGADMPGAVDAAGVVAHDRRASSWWKLLALLLALLWLATLAWAAWLWLRTRQSPAPMPARAATGGSPRPVAADLRRVLDTGSFDEAARMLERMASPPASGLDQVIARLADPSQQHALEAMRRALWAGHGDPGQARMALRAAFRHGPVWKASGHEPAAPLAPLYPTRQAGR